MCSSSTVSDPLVWRVSAMTMTADLLVGAESLTPSPACTAKGFMNVDIAPPYPSRPLVSGLGQGVAHTSGVDAEGGKSVCEIIDPGVRCAVIRQRYAGF